MIKKGLGLCSSCINGKKCVFTKSASVWQCEEFSIDESARREGPRNKKVARR